VAETADVAVVGAGPAGIAAASRAAAAGARVVLLDEGLAAGGQIWRARDPEKLPPRARRWIARLGRSGARVLAGAGVVDAAPTGAGFSLLSETESGPLRVEAARLVLASGARERFLPFPGWTLPNVLGVGAGQALLKSGASFEGKRVVVAGSGPLLLPVAALLARGGARVLHVLEQAPASALLRFALGLASRPGKLLEAARYRAAFADTPYATGAWVTRVESRGRALRAALSVGAQTISAECDVVLASYGLVGETALARLLGCAIEDGFVAVSDDQETSVAGVYCAGEPTGVAGADAALVEGEIAGLAAAGRAAEAAPLHAARDRGRAFASALLAAFRPRAELLGLADETTVVCRCEDVTRGAVRPGWTLREAKLATRAGMGPCQGRVCGPALEALFGWTPDTVRPPVKPASVGALAER
jgi:NADPH-dependent 2,4-dienoyl-CoA reductase/sulfur reductase-like enzyme